MVNRNPDDRRDSIGPKAQSASPELRSTHSRHSNDQNENENEHFSSGDTINPNQYFDGGITFKPGSNRIGVPGGRRINDGVTRRAASSSPPGSKNKKDDSEVRLGVRHMNSLPAGTSFGKKNVDTAEVVRSLDGNRSAASASVQAIPPGHSRRVWHVGERGVDRNEPFLRPLDGRDLDRSVSRDNSPNLNDQSYLVGKPLSPESKKDLSVPVMKNKLSGGMGGMIRRFKSQGSGERFVEKAWSLWSGKGHVQMGVRAVIQFFQAICSFFVVYAGIDPWHNSVTMGVQAFNACTLVHQFYTNWHGDFILRSFTQLLRAVSAAHSAACGRRSFLAFWWTDEEVAADYEAAVQRGYPTYLPQHSRVCFDITDVTDTDKAGIPPSELEAEETLLPFRVIYCFNCVFLICYAFSLFMHGMFPSYGAVAAPPESYVLDADDSQPEPEAEAETPARRSFTRPPDFNFSFIYLCTMFDLEPAVPTNAREGTPRRRIHGCIWIKVRCLICACLACCQLTAGLLKLVLIPDDSFFSRETGEIAANFLRFFCRSLAAWSLYIQYWKPRLGWHCGTSRVAPESL